MIRFLDGPAAGVILFLRRAPVFLRVVRNDRGEWDALDQLADTPAGGERIYAYRRQGRPGTLHVDYADRRGRRGEWWATATYQVIEPAPDEATLRETLAWRRWCLAEWARRKGGSHGT